MQVHFSGMDPKFLSNSQKSIFDSKGLSTPSFLVGFCVLSLWWTSLVSPFFFFSWLGPGRSEAAGPRW